MTHLIRWHVTLDANNDQAFAILSQDPVWNCFALADLEPPFRDYSQFAIAAQDEGSQRALCLILRHPIIGQVFSPFGSEEGVAHILSQLALPECLSIQAQERHIPLLQRYYQPETTWRSMFRMAMTSISALSFHAKPRRSVQRLTIADLPALKNLYMQNPESVFSADLFTQGIYYGVYEGERIVAAGGTQVFVPAHRIAVLGHIFTLPEARGQGYATAITAALVTALFQQHFSYVVLNVFADNSAAIHVYQRLGFQMQHRLVSGNAMLV